MFLPYLSLCVMFVETVAAPVILTIVHVLYLF